MSGDDVENALVVGVGDLAVGRERDVRLVTYALGSCIGLSAFDPVARIGGLLHFMLPQPAAQSDSRALKACLYATTGIPLLMRRLGDAGVQQKRLVVCAAGGAEILEGTAGTAIGQRNHTMLRKMLWKLGVTLAAEDTGGGVARTMLVDLVTGEVRIRTRDTERVLWTPGTRPRERRRVEA